VRIQGSVADIYLGQSAVPMFGADPGLTSFVVQDGVGGPNMVVGTIGNGSLVLGTNGLTRLRVQEDGQINVGDGKSYLRVDGSANFGGLNLQQMAFAAGENTGITLPWAELRSQTNGVGGLLLVCGYNASGYSFMALYGMALRIAGGAGNDAWGGLIYRTGDGNANTSPPIDFGEDNGRLRVNIGAGGNATWATTIGMFTNG
jgi:hypothetical protein